MNAFQYLYIDFLLTNDVMMGKTQRRMGKVLVVVLGGGGVVEHYLPCFQRILWQ
jgi:hypothetical protein